MDKQTLIDSFTLPKPKDIEDKFLGAGSYGRAYAVSDEVALKVTSDPIEVGIARKLVGEKLRRVWEIYKVQEMTPEEQKEWGAVKRGARWYILGERLYPLGRELRQNIRDSALGFFGWKQNSVVARVLAECNEELSRYGLCHRDEHMGNMGQTKGGRGHGRPRLKILDIRG